jgi:hypothetical protein
VRIALIVAAIERKRMIGRHISHVRFVVLCVQIFCITLAKKNLIGRACIGYRWLALLMV